MPPQKKSKQSRFPVARIKKIMQMDEEVGKLAGATPVMISKSLECFLQVLLDETSKQTRSRGSKKMTAHHLKQTINTLETLDFLRPLVTSIPDPAPPSAPTPRAPARKQSAVDPLTGEPLPPKKRAGRKPKNEGEVLEGEREAPPAAGGSLPHIGMWRREPEGGGGSGEGGRGLYDDYEDDEDDY